MQGRMVRSWAPLGVLLICLHLPGLSARSIGAAEEKAPQDSGTNLLLPGQPSSTGPSNSEHPQSQPELKSNDLRSAPLNPNASPSDGSQAAGGPGVQSWAPSEGLSYVDSWAYEDPWQMMAAGNEDYVGEALPQELYFFSNDADLPPGSGPLPAGSSGHPTGAQPETSLSQKDPESTQPPLSNTGAQEQTFTQRPFWNFINKIRQALLSGRPCGLLKPRVPLAGKGPATGLGTRPMPHPGVLGGIKNPNTGWGNINRFPGISGGNMNQFPGITGGNMNQFPGIGGGIINRIPGINNLFPPGVAHPPGSSRSISPDLANPENAGSE
ncbi:uncharacterized protein C6orf15 homolog [Talpa occidentalis]|uniref:uncharacterized protein C6orf15 homolog n=1 Tax=Talpa occidentalis TaxID=50954 RepID=UPI00188E0911|nr:uncharacterized protein C6orf15 homolog [Talpa occidentalis]